MNTNNPWKGLGGYMPNPPADCKKSIFSHDDIKFIDYSNCIRCECKRKKEYQKECKKYRKGQYNENN